MKKLLSKIRRKKEEPISNRVTTETVAEHRERILAGGRRFKYPIQYSKHKLVINAVIISTVALVAVIIAGYWQLYRVQNSSEFMYRVTKVIPLPVAYVDGQPVLFSDYLMKYRSSVHYLEQKEQVNLKSDSGKKQIEFIKQQSMQDAIADAYAKKIAKTLGVTISDEEIDLFLRQQRQSSDGEISEQTYEAVILDYYDWSQSEYRHVTSNKLLRQKVAYKMDDIALKSINSADVALKNNQNLSLKDLAMGDAKKAIYGTSGWVPKNNQDGGLSETASKMTKEQLSAVIKSTIGEGYYIIRLLDINDDQLKYEYIRVPLTAFDANLNNIINSKKVNKFIDLN